MAGNVFAVAVLRHAKLLQQWLLPLTLYVGATLPPLRFFIERRYYRRATLPPLNKSDRRCQYNLEGGHDLKEPNNIFFAGSMLIPALYEKAQAPG